jgi:dethiobiotin synthetase
MIAVVGSGTGVGKTVVSAILLEAFHGEYWKPIQCGHLDQSDTITVESLVTHQGSRFHSEAYRFHAPLSPHHASRLENVKIISENIILPKTQNTLIIEGVGGLLVPMNSDTLFIDLLVHWKIPCLLVSKHYLGSINHTLLSIEALNHRKLDLRGIVFNGPSNEDTEQTIQSRSALPIAGRLAQEPKITPKTIKKYACQWKSQLKHLFP